jgi:hypothetical protein
MRPPKPSEVLASLRGEVADLEAYCAVLKGALASYGVEAPDPPRFMLRGLTRAEATIIGALFQAWPNPVDPYDLLARMPTRADDRDPLDRRRNAVSVRVHRLRKLLGRDAIETDRLLGYKLGDAFREELRKPRADACAPPPPPLRAPCPMCGTQACVGLSGP